MTKDDDNNAANPQDPLSGKAQEVAAAEEIFIELELSSSSLCSTIRCDFERACQRGRGRLHPNAASEPTSFQGDADIIAGHLGLRDLRRVIQTVG
jgi:hypothetical protein